MRSELVIMLLVLTPAFLPMQRTLPSVSAAQPLNMLGMFVTLLVVMLGTDVRDEHLKNMAFMFVTLLVFMFGTDVSE